MLQESVAAKSAGDKGKGKENRTALPEVQFEVYELKNTNRIAKDAADQS